MMTRIKPTQVNALAWAWLVAMVSLVVSAPLEPKADQDEPSQITVTSLGGGSVRRVDFCPSEDTVAKLKAKLSELDGASPTRDDIRLVYAGKQLEDDRLLADYGIQRDSNVISLQRPGAVAPEKAPAQPLQRLFVKTITGETIEVPADGHLTVGMLKRVIETHKRGEMLAEQQELIFNGIVLEDDRTLSECGLKDESTIGLTVKTVSGFNPVRTPGAQSEVIMIEGTKEEVAAELAKHFGGGGGKTGKVMAKLCFTHNEAFADVHTVEALIEERMTSQLEATSGHLAPVLVEMFKLAEMRFEFKYEHRGHTEGLVASMREGAQWVADQARAASEQEAYERDLAKHSTPLPK